MDSALIAQGIGNYIEEKWIRGSYDIDVNIEVDYRGNGDYLAICTFYHQGIGADIRGRLMLTFKDVVDATDEFIYDDDMWCSAYVDVASCKIDTFDTVHTEDFAIFTEFAKQMHNCLHDIYYSLPSEGERYYFYVG